MLGVIPQLLQLQLAQATPHDIPDDIPCLCHAETKQLKHRRGGRLVHHLWKALG